MTEAGSVQAKDTSACCLGRTAHGDGGLAHVHGPVLPAWRLPAGGTGGSVCGGVERVSECVSKYECERV